MTNCARMPGFGDLPGDNTNPNSPDYIEPDTDAAIDAYAKRLVREDEVAELVEELYEAGNTVLVALNHYANGRAFDYNTATLVRRLRSIAQSVEAA